MRLLLLNILAGRESPVVESLLGDELAGPDSPHALHYVLRYAHAFAARDLIASLKRWILATPARVQSTVAAAVSFAPSVLRELLNDADLMDAIPFTYAGPLYQTLRKNQEASVRLLLEQSSLARLYAGKRLFFLKRDGSRMVPCELDDATQAVAYIDGERVKDAHRDTPESPSPGFQMLLEEYAGPV
jgi:hypothetical protein